MAIKYIIFITLFLLSAFASYTIFSNINGDIPSKDSPIVTTQYAQPIGPLMGDGSFYSKKQKEVNP